MGFIPFILLIILAFVVLLGGIGFWVNLFRMHRKESMGGGMYLLLFLGMIVLVIITHFYIDSFRLSNAWRNFGHNLWTGFLAIILPVFVFTAFGMISYYVCRFQYETEEERQKRKKRNRRSRGMPW